MVCDPVCVWFVTLCVCDPVCVMCVCVCVVCDSVCVCVCICVCVCGLCQNSSAALMCVSESKSNLFVERVNGLFGSKSNSFENECEIYF